MTSEMDLLKQENARLMAENAEFKVKYDEAKDEITKLRAELRNRIKELEKARIDTAVKNTRRDVENDSSPEKSADIPDSIVANEVISVNSKSSEEKMMDSFLDEVNKKIVSDGIRQRKRVEKLAKVESVSPEKGKQVSVDKKTLRKKEQREKFIQEVSRNDSIPSVSFQRESDSSTNCSNIIDEPGLNSLDVCLEQTVRSCDPLAVEMGTPTFSLLYEKLCDAVILADRAVQEAIIRYCQFGKALIQRQSEIASEKQVDPESNAVSRILNEEVRAQLPADTSDALLWKRIKQAKKLWKLFDAIGMDKIYQIHSFSVSSISKITYKDIQYIIDNMSVDYSIKIESSTCAQPKETLLSDEKNSELSHPDLSSGSDKKNSELSHTNTSKSKILDQYSNLYRECSIENFDYYGITDETTCEDYICLLCKLGHDDEKIEDWHAKLSGLPSVLTDKIRSKLYKKYKKQTGNEPWQLSEAVIDMLAEPCFSASGQASDFKPITFEARPNPELIIKSVLEHFPYLKF
ncbi:hypothetical protein RhiirB3_487531 [Rhizophagus irregularis]|nr:hypothetical protein RhiirB3_487531 [Rhizophagus irregularis]